MGINQFVFGGKVKLDLTKDTVTADKMIAGITAHDRTGTVVTGKVADNGKLSLTLDGLKNQSVIIPAGYTSGGGVTLSDSIEKALAGL